MPGDVDVGTARVAAKAPLASAAPCFEPLAWFASGPPNDARKLIAAPAGAPVRRTVKLPPGTMQAGCTVPARPAASAGTAETWAIAATATPNTSSLAIVFRFIGIRNPGAVWHSEGPSQRCTWPVALQIEGRR